jgi:hypothetical protein
MTLPASLALRVKFKPDDKERVFDFTFPDYSKEPVPGLPAGVPASVPVVTPSTPSVSPTPVTATNPPAGPVARDEALPGTTAELLAELAKDDQSVTALLDKGDLAGLWYPAIAAKDIALALEENHINDIPESQRPNMRSAVKRLTFAAWQIDAAGDLGNKERLLPLYKDFSAAVADIKMMYESK